MFESVGARFERPWGVRNGYEYKEVCQELLKVLAVLDGEVAVPCTRNPLKRGRIPGEGLSPVGSDSSQW